MKRQDKYPDTTTFHYFNANPHNRITTDCVIRALCVGMNKPYNDVVLELAQMQIETGYDDGDNKLYEKYLKKNGFVMLPQPRKADNTKYTGKQFCRKKFYKNCICHIGGHHIVAIKDFKVWDIWDSTDGCIGKVWYRPE